MQVLDRGRRAAGDADDRGAVECLGVGQVTHGLDLDRLRTHDAAQARELLRVRRRSTADHDHEVNLARGLERVLLASDGHGTHRVDDLELVAARDHERSELLELPRRLGGLADQRHLLAARDLLPVLFLIDHDDVRGEAEQAHDLRMLRRPEEHDRVALVDELDDLLLLLDHPCAGAVDDLEAALARALHHVRSNTVRADDHGGAAVHVIERVHGLDPERLQVANHALVVHDLTERVRDLAGRARLLGLVDRLAHAVAEPGSLGDPDLRDGPVTCCHDGTSIPRARFRPVPRRAAVARWSGTRVPRFGRRRHVGAAGAARRCAS